MLFVVTGEPSLCCTEERIFAFSRNAGSVILVCWWWDLSYKMYAGPGWLVNVEPPEMHQNICYKENLYFCTWKELEHNRR